MATSYYVRAGAAGSSNGTSWANAWPNVSSISWSSIAPGDTIWIAGGSYGTMTIGKSGTADTATGRIFIKRATGAAHGSDTGWSAGFDSLVTVAGMTWSALNVGSYVTVDGQVDAGILIPHGDGSGNTSVSFDRGNSYVTLRNLDLAGPSDLHSHHHTGDDRSLDLTAWNGSSYDVIDHLTVQYVRFHGTCTAIWNMRTSNAIFEYNQIYNVFDDNGAVCHPDVFVTSGTTNLTFRFNKIYQYEDEGIMALNGDNGTMYIYGNLWYAQTNTNARIMETQMGANGPAYFYNNTIDGISLGVMTANGGNWAAGSQGRNNIWWNTGCNGLSDTDYDFTSSGSCSGTHSIHSGSNPFGDLLNHDYSLISTVGSTFPRGKGVDLGAPYDVDANGTARGASGAWDIGAYAFYVLGAALPAPPQGVTVTAK
ncbi:MAG: hypothetical protein P4L87_22975 [Formivibrio sp.]|nr:hypothetical protein [Formivibrio sp.]